MRKIPDELLREMAALCSAEDAAEMAIPSYLHANPVMRTMAWWRVFLLAERLEIAAKRRRDLRIVDFGCGSGVLFEEASIYAREIIGVDLVTAPGRLLAERLGLIKVRMLTPDEAARDLADGSVDVILAGEVLEHVEPLGPTLALFKRWLAPGGKLLVTLPTEGSLYKLGRKLAGFSGHYHHSNARSIDEEMRAEGFDRTHRRMIPLGGPLSIYWCADYIAR